ncbi:hypothetical protein [Rhizobium sp. K102]|uniref:hypothetical protein n=1 Tax=Rhizobium sp. K102 TaxID=2918527 RepID=UPI001EFB9315|nr:hypothetical protein [Rhizobium sp. K102]ULR45603.1 hypothetical protein MHI61_10570 [Rhizobium sp. K102]
MEILSFSKCLRALRPFTVTALAVAMCFALPSCSYLFTTGVEGSYTATGTPLLGLVASQDERTGGSLTIGSAEKQQCRGEYRVSEIKTNRWKLETGERIYRGRIYCLDGRAGEFKLVSSDKGRTGSITGEIDGQAFQVNLKEWRESDCNSGECRWGLKWTYENERSNSQIYWKVENDHKPNPTGQ